MGWRLNCSDSNFDVAQHDGNRLVHYQGNWVVHIDGNSLVHYGGNSTSFLKKYTGSWFSASNSASVNGKGMISLVVTVISESAEGINFNLSGRCEYYANSSESLLSDFTSNNNGSSLLVDQLGNIFLKCNGQKFPAGRMSDDALNVSLANCPDTGVIKSIGLATVQDGAQINFSGRNFDDKNIRCDSVIKK